MRSDCFSLGICLMLPLLGSESTRPEQPEHRYKVKLVVRGSPSLTDKVEVRLFRTLRDLGDVDFGHDDFDYALSVRAIESGLQEPERASRVALSMVVHASQRIQKSPGPTYGAERMEFEHLVFFLDHYVTVCRPTALRTACESLIIRFNRFQLAPMRDARERLLRAVEELTEENSTSDDGAGKEP